MERDSQVFHSLAIIEERIQEKLTVEALAENVHFSKYHYQRMFREVVGESVMGYVTRRRLILAAGELAQTDRTVLEIALRYGYDSHEGFTRSFKACMGVTPSEYRKYHPFIATVRVGKEKKHMMYSKATDEIIRELNGLIVEAKETAAYTRKHKRDMPETEALYGQFWEYAADRAEEMAERLTEDLERVTGLAGQPDGISARFLMVKAIEDIAFISNLIAFQTGLTIARARPEHREASEALCGKYRQLAEQARVKAGKIADFLSELSALIFQDMRREAAERIEKTVAAGKAAAEKLSNPELPYGYIAEEIQDISERLSDMPLEEVTIYELEESLFRLETIFFAVQTDLLRAPEHEELFDGITNLKECLNETLGFFRSLPEGVAESNAHMREETESNSQSGREIESVSQAGAARSSSPSEKQPEFVRSPEKLCQDLAAQEGILLFYLKGEIQKLGAAYLTEAQKKAFQDISAKLKQMIDLAYRATGEAQTREIAGLLREVYDDLTVQAGELGAYGGAIQYIAEEVKWPLCYLPQP